MTRETITLNQEEHRRVVVVLMEAVRILGLADP